MRSGEVVPPNELGMIVSNIGVTPGFSAIYTPNSAPHTAFRPGELERGTQSGQLRIHESSARRQLHEDLPQLSAYFQIGRIGGFRAEPRHARSDRRSGQRDEPGQGSRHSQRHCANKVRRLPRVSDVLVPQDIDYPALQHRHRPRAGEPDLGLSQKEVVDNVITALTSNQMIAPSYWVDPKKRQRLSADCPVSGRRNPLLK